MPVSARFTSPNSHNVRDGRWRWLFGKRQQRDRDPRPKVFCLGRNKTGTTSLAGVLGEMGYRVGDQEQAELLLEDWARRDFGSIMEYCRSANAFQDIPFSLPFTFQVVDAAFPGSKFILSVRGSADEWYESLTRFHTKLVGAGRLPTCEELQRALYRDEISMWRVQQLIYGVDETTLYDKTLYTRHYESYNREVLYYFQHLPDSLLVLNLSDEDCMRQLCKFLKAAFDGWQMPHLNASS